MLQFRMILVLRKKYCTTYSNGSNPNRPVQLHIELLEDLFLFQQRWELDKNLLIRNKHGLLATLFALPYSKQLLFP